MQLLVVGGTGTLGRQIAREAIDAGHQVRCMVRSPRKAAFLQEWGCELTRGDLLDPESLDYALEGQEAVIDAATARATDPGSAYEIDWTGKQNLFAACQGAGVKRLVFISLLNAAQHRDVPAGQSGHRAQGGADRIGVGVVRIIDDGEATAVDFHAPRRSRGALEPFGEPAERDAKRQPRGGRCGSVEHLVLPRQR